MSKMKHMQQFLIEKSQAYFDSGIECLQWFVDDRIEILYHMIEKNQTLEQWLEYMSNRIIKLGGQYFILEEEDLLEATEYIRHHSRQS